MKGMDPCFISGVSIICVTVVFAEWNQLENSTTTTTTKLNTKNAFQMGPTRGISGQHKLATVSYLVDFAHTHLG